MGKKLIKRVEALLKIVCQAEWELPNEATRGELIERAVMVESELVELGYGEIVKDTRGMPVYQSFETDPEEN